MTIENGNNWSGKNSSDRQSHPCLLDSNDLIAKNGCRSKATRINASQITPYALLDGVQNISRTQRETQFTTMSRRNTDETLPGEKPYFSDQRPSDQVKLNSHPQEHNVANSNASNSQELNTSRYNTQDDNRNLESQEQNQKLPSLFSPQLKKERRLLFKTIIKVEVLLIVIVLGILSLYWGGLASLLPNQRVLTVAMVDFDGGEIGNALTQFGSSQSP